jgi:hypothetical protein
MADSVMDGKKSGGGGSLRSSKKFRGAGGSRVLVRKSKH